MALIPQILTIQWLRGKPQWIEDYYSTGIYPHISSFFRWLLGWIPFSVGDILYTGLVLFAIGYIIKYWRTIIKHKMLFLRDVAMVLSIAYFTFYMCWGLNYYRLPIANKFELQETEDVEDLIAFTKTLILKTNTVQEQVTKDSAVAVQLPYTQQQQFEATLRSYVTLAKKHPFLEYQQPSVKTSLFSTVLTYMGYAGYLNPFTNEAQVNGLLPHVRFPVVTAHEMGHQLGYSAENETNFIGYLATVNSTDAYYKYVAYSYALAYCLNDVRRYDEDVFEALMGTINEGVRLNYSEMSDFWDAYENPMEPIFKGMFNTFLKANHQAKGIQSYNAVVSLLIGYHKQYPL